MKGALIGAIIGLLVYFLGGGDITDRNPNVAISLMTGAWCGAMLSLFGWVRKNG